jgi:hypothetical protein
MSRCHTARMPTGRHMGHRVIGPFLSRDEAVKDAQETLGITEGEVDR